MRSNFSRALLVALVLGPATTATAGKLETAFAALEIHDYFKARELLLGQVRKHPAAAWYGLSVISGRDDNPFHQLDSAYACIQRADAAFTATGDKERLLIKPLGVDDDAIRAQRERLHEIAWDQAKALNTIDAYDRYINTYLQSGRAEEARLVRNYLAYQQARSLNTAAAYQDFITRYPGAREIYEARTHLQEAAYREATPDRTLEQFEHFIRENPESPQVRNAEDEIYRLSTTPRTAENFRAFIASHPLNHRVPDAWRNLYELSTRVFSAGSITQFLKDNPGYPFIAELAADYTIASLWLYAFRRDSLWGFVDEQGLERIKAEFEWVEAFVAGQALVGRGGRVGTINKNGKEVIPIQYDDVQEFSEGLASVERAGKAGAVDRRGDLSVPMEFDEVGEFSGGLAYARRDERYGFIDARGGERLTFQFDIAGTMRNGLAVVEKDGLNGVVDGKGTVVVPFEYEWIEGFAAGVSRARKDGKTGLIDAAGTVVLPVEHEHVGVMNDGRALVIDGGRCGYVDAHGRWVIPQDHEAPAGLATWGDFHNGFAEVSRKGQHGLIDTVGNVAIDPIFQDVGRVDGPLVPVKKGDKWGYSRIPRDLVVPTRYDQAWEMEGGFARATRGGKFALLDSLGKEVIKPSHEQMTDPRHGMLVVTNGDRTGVIDIANNVLLPLEHDGVKILDDAMVQVERNGRLALYRVDTKQFIWKEHGFDLPEPAPR